MNVSTCLRSAAAISSALIVSSCHLQMLSPSAARGGDGRCRRSRCRRRVATMPPSTVGSTTTFTSTCLPVAAAERLGAAASICVVVERRPRCGPRRPRARARPPRARRTGRRSRAGRAPRPAPTTNDASADASSAAPCRPSRSSTTAIAPLGGERRVGERHAQLVVALERRAKRNSSSSTSPRWPSALRDLEQRLRVRLDRGRRPSASCSRPGRCSSR